MRRFLLLMLLTPTLAFGDPMVILSNLSTVLSITGWIQSIDGEQYELEVEASGATIEEARKEGFKLAVTQTLGAITAATTRVEDQKVVQNEILTASSGFVSDYEITSHTFNNNLHTVRMTVQVSRTHIENRFLSNPSRGMIINGSKLATLRESHAESQQETTHFIDSTFSNFESQAFVFEVKEVRYTIADELVLDFDAYWNPAYIRAIDDVISGVSSNTWLSKEVKISHKGQLRSSNINVDDVVYESVKSNLANQFVNDFGTLYAAVNFDFGKVQRCEWFKIYPLLTISNDRINIKGRNTQEYTLSTKITAAEMKSIESVNISLGGNC